MIKSGTQMTINRTPMTLIEQITTDKKIKDLC